MASFGHIAVGMAAGRAFTAGAPHTGREGRLASAMVLFSILSVWPDVDVVGFHFGIAYGDPLGHRGATHSITAAVLVGITSTLLAAWTRLPAVKTALYVTLVALSHGLLDTCTFGGGRGVELLWPFSYDRFWSPLRFIPVAPIGLGMLSLTGLLVVGSEVVIFAPLWLYAIWPRRVRRTQTAPTENPPP